jgi:hypothetical protein
MANQAHEILPYGQDLLKMSALKNFRLNFFGKIFLDTSRENCFISTISNLREKSHAGTAGWLFVLLLLLFYLALTLRPRLLTSN